MGKGGSYEITIARDLTKWITGSPKPELFWRTKGLGPKGTKDEIKDKSRHGDIMPYPQRKNGEWLTDRTFWEIKCYEEGAWTFNQLLKGTGPIFPWWDKLFKQSDEAGKFPIMVLKRNLYPPIMSFDWRFPIGCYKTIKKIDSLDFLHERYGFITFIKWTDFLERLTWVELKETLDEAAMIPFVPKSVEPKLTQPKTLTLK